MSARDPRRVELREEERGREAGGLIGRKLSARAILRRIRDSPGSYPSVRFRIPRACIGFLLPPPPGILIRRECVSRRTERESGLRSLVYSPVILHADTAAANHTQPGSRINFPPRGFAAITQHSSRRCFTPYHGLGRSIQLFLEARAIATTDPASLPRFRFPEKLIASSPVRFQRPV